MNQEERRLAMLRMRGELPQEQETPQPPKSSGQAPRKGKKPGKGRKKAHLSKKALLQRKRRQRALFQLGLYITAFVILILAVSTALKGCGEEKEPGMKNQTQGVSAEESTSVPETDAVQMRESEEQESDAQPSAGGEPEETKAAVNASVKAVENNGSGVDISHITTPEWIDQMFLTPNPISRPQTPMKDIKYIAIHWVANPGTTAKANRDYFEQLGDPNDPAYGLKASAQFVVGLEGEVIQCMPLDEMAYAVKDKYNPYTISIEVCHPDSEGKFSDITYASVIRLTAWLMQQFDLGEDAILRHYDCTGKDCPKYYVVHEDAWLQLKQDVMDYYYAHPSIS